MPFELLEGFESFGLTPTDTQDGVEQKYAASSNMSTATVQAGRTGGVSLKLGTGAAMVLRANGLFNTTELSIGMAAKITAFPGAGTIQILGVNANTAATALLDIQITSTGTINIRRQLVVVAAAASKWPLDSDWHSLKVYFESDATSGVVEVYVDDVLAVSFTGDTVGTGTEAGTSFTSFSLRNTNTVGEVWFDDLYIFSGGKFTDDCAVFTLFPDGIGDDTNFTPSAGDNFECVDESPADDDTTYNEASGTGTSDLYEIEDMPPAPVAAVQVNVRCRSTSGSQTVRAHAKIGSTTYDRGSNNSINTTWQEVRFMMEENPSTTAPWEASEISAMQAGQKTGL